MTYLKENYITIVIQRCFPANTKVFIRQTKFNNNMAYHVLQKFKLTIVLYDKFNNFISIEDKEITINSKLINGGNIWACLVTSQTSGNKLIKY